MAPMESKANTCGETIEMRSAWARKAGVLGAPLRVYQRASSGWARTARGNPAARHSAAKPHLANPAGNRSGNRRGNREAAGRFRRWVRVVMPEKSRPVAPGASGARGRPRSPTAGPAAR